MPATGEDPRPLRLAMMAIIGMFFHFLVVGLQLRQAGKGFGVLACGDTGSY